MMLLDYFRQSVLSFYLRAYINSYNRYQTYKRELRKMAHVVNDSNCIWKMPGLNLGQDTEYYDKMFIVFLCPSTQMPG
jgi:hypothetical protein